MPVAAVVVLEDLAQLRRAVAEVPVARVSAAAPAANMAAAAPVAAITATATTIANTTVRMMQLHLRAAQMLPRQTPKRMKMVQRGTMKNGGI